MMAREAVLQPERVAEMQLARVITTLDKATSRLPPRLLPCRSLWISLSISRAVTQVSSAAVCSSEIMYIHSGILLPLIYSIITLVYNLSM